MDELIEALCEAEAVNFRGRPCRACEAVRMLHGERREAVERALSGTIGEQKLAAILSSNVTQVGRRDIHRHRTERHQP